MQTTLKDLKHGQMFQFPDEPANTYMRVMHPTLGYGAVLLSTGNLYIDFAQHREVKIVKFTEIFR
jgi:hypothetical protein